MNINLAATAAGKPPIILPNNKSTTNTGSDHSTFDSAATLAPTQTSSSTATATSSKALKRCLSVPIIHTLPGAPPGGTITTMTTRSAAAAAAAVANCSGNNATETRHETPKKYQTPDSSTMGNFGHNIHIGIPRSNPSSREVSPAPVFNIFGSRARRYSASYSPLGAAVAAAGGGPATSASGAPLCITPRVSQLRQEECVDMNSREVNHEREVHSAMQMSQSWEDLTLVAENWSCKSDEFSNPLQVVLPSSASMTSCSSPSPTNNRAGLRLPYGLSPSPTRRTFATRRSMSPIAMRPSQLGPVKRKFELDDNTSSNWNVYSPPPLKKIFTESRGSSPVAVGQSPSSVCPSPDSGTYDGRITPKLFISKLCTTNTNNNSACSSPMSASPSNSGAIDSTATSTLCSSSSSSSSYASSISGGSEPMSMCIGSNIDEGISISEVDEKPQCERAIISTTTNRTAAAHGMSTDLQDDDMKSETSSIGGCSSISIESFSCDSGAKAAATFLNKLTADDVVNVSSSLGQKNFFINKQGRGAKKFIVNHDNLPNSTSEHFDDGITKATPTNVAEAIAAASVIVENKM